MYSKKSTEELNRDLAKAGSVLILPAAEKPPEDALVATCDSCGAQLWIPAGLKSKLTEDNHRTFCHKCLQVRQIL